MDNRSFSFGPRPLRSIHSSHPHVVSSTECVVASTLLHPHPSCLPETGHFPLPEIILFVSGKKLNYFLPLPLSALVLCCLFPLSCSIFIPRSELRRCLTLNQPKLQIVGFR